MSQRVLRLIHEGDIRRTDCAIQIQSDLALALGSVVLVLRF
jgi:hypothetical protein